MRGFSLSVVLASVLALGPSVHAAAPPTAPEPAAPLFGNPDAFHVNPLHLVMHGFAGRVPHTWPAVLHAGHHKHVAVWNLEGPMTGFQGRVVTGTATTVLNSFSTNPLSTLATLRYGDHLNCWALRDTDQFYKLPREWLATLKDGQPFFEGDPESESYARILTLANFTSDKAFRSQARTDITATHLLGDPTFYRGQVVQIEGFVRRINRFRPPPESEVEGVNDLYEAWIFPDTMNAQAFCVVFTEWPAGMPRSALGKSKLDPGIRVQVAGYFVKLFGYGTADRNQREKKAPLLVAHTLTVMPPVVRPETPGAGWIKSILYIVPTMLVGLIFAAVGLTYFLRRQDARLRERLRLARDAEFVPPPPDALPVAAPVPGAGPARMPVRGYRLRPPSHRGPFPGEDPGPSESGGKPPDDVTGV